VKFFRKFKLYKVDVPSNVDLKPEGRHSLAALKDNAGFAYLVTKLRLQRAHLESALKYERMEKIEDVIRLQEGIRWMTWLENQFLLAVNNPTSRVERGPNDDELAALQSALSFIEGVGK
jgi:hypothetical protein